jgi:hypothetical protein
MQWITRRLDRGRRGKVRALNPTGCRGLADYPFANAENSGSVIRTRCHSGITAAPSDL